MAKLNTPWTIRIPSFSIEQRNSLEKIAKAHRMNIGAYVGNLLEEIIKSSEKESVCTPALPALETFSLNTPTLGAGEALSNEIGPMSER